MRSMLVAAALVAACAAAVLVLDQPASAQTVAAQTDVGRRATCCAFPDQDLVDPSGYAVRVPIRWHAHGDGHGGLVVDGDQGEQLWILPLPDGPAFALHDPAAALADVMARAVPGRPHAVQARAGGVWRAVVLDSDPAWLQAVIAPRAEGPGAVLWLFRAERRNVPALARRFDTVVQSVRDPRGRALAPVARFDALVAER